MPGRSVATPNVRSASEAVTVSPVSAGFGLDRGRGVPYRTCNHPGPGRGGRVFRHFGLHHVDGDDQADRPGNIPLAQGDAGRAAVLGRNLDHGGGSRGVIGRYDPIASVLALPRCRRPGVACPDAGMDVELRDVLLPVVRGRTADPAAPSTAVAHRRTVQPECDRHCVAAAWRRAAYVYQPFVHRVPGRRLAIGARSAGKISWL